MTIRIEWVIHDGARVPVATFAGLAPAQRPDVRCPACGSAVTLKLGSVRRHHAAHQPGSTCAATGPETALHINVKCHIAAELTRAIGTGAALRIARNCIGQPSAWAERCRETLDETWVPRWDDVRIEFRVRDATGHRVPDIVLLDRGAPVAAIEVLVSHAVDADKASMLATLGVPWIEIVGDESLYRSPGAWTIARPLEPGQASMPLSWVCERHAQASEVRELNRHAMRVSEGLASASAVESLRIADVYRPDGSTLRLTYTIRGTTDSGALRRLTLHRGDAVVATYLAESNEPPTEFRARVAHQLQHDYESNLAGERVRGSITDSPMRWLRGEDTSAPINARRFPQRYRYEPRQPAWEIKPELADARWPVTVTAADARQDIEAAIRGRRRGPHTSLTPREED